MEDLTGKVLVAMPSIGDPRFSRSVILLCAHQSDYAMGIVLNKPMDDLKLPDLLEQLNIEPTIQLPPQDVLNGGPMAQDRGFVVHSSDYFSDGATLDVTPDLCMTATHDILKSIASGGAPANATMALGYAGWGAGQLEEELAENAWIVSQANDDILFGSEHENKWAQALEIIGINSAHLHSGGGQA